MGRFIQLFVSAPEKDRKNNINIIRFFAAAMVIYGHMSHLAGFAMPTLFGEDISTIAVKIFFVLSGYLITQSFLRDENFIRYGIRRIFRILPGLIFVVAVTVFCLGPFLSSLGLREYFMHQDTYFYLMNCLLYPVYYLPGVFESNLYPNAVNGSLWTLPVEFFMYIILPLFIVVLRKLRILKVGLFALTLLFFFFDLAYIAWFPDARLIIWGTNIFDGMTLAPYFFAGAVFTFPKVQAKLKLQVATLMILIGAGLTFSYYWQYEIVLFLILPYVTLACSFPASALFGRVFAVNDYSYGLYLWGFLTQQTIVSILGADAMGMLPYTLLCIAIAFVCAIVSWHFVEKPCNMLGKKLTGYSRKCQENKKIESTP